MVLVSGGGYAEYVAAHMGYAMKIIEGISMVEAAGEYFMLFVLK
jgi:D-arabinose 1-dehydrogenase-like Zn-dependent alcohol dehydrogenase